MTIELIYLHHDCFLLKTPQFSVVFDYYADSDGEAKDRPGFFDYIDPEKPLYVLVSHHHKDHFTKKIFEWQQMHGDVRYIISKDVGKFSRHILREDSLYKGVRPKPGSVVTLKKGEEYNDSLLCVRAFGSTDIGNSYLISAGDKKIFHAGDLNAWIWKDESTAAEVEASLREFRAIVSDIAEIAPKIDIVMFPVDSRIGTEYYSGASIFVNMIDVCYFIPMHFCLAENDEDLEWRRRCALRFREYANLQRGAYIGLTRPGDCVMIN